MSAALRVVTVERFRPYSGVMEIRLVAAPWQGGDLWRPPAPVGPDAGLMALADEVVEALRLAGRPLRSTAVARAVGRRQQRVAEALQHLLAAGRVCRRRERAAGNPSWLWGLA